MHVVLPQGVRVRVKQVVGVVAMAVVVGVVLGRRDGGRVVGGGARHDGVEDGSGGVVLGGSAGVVLGGGASVVGRCVWMVLSCVSCVSRVIIVNFELAFARPSPTCKNHTGFFHFAKIMQDSST